MSNWGSAIDIDSDSLYKASYGDLPDEMVIDDGMNNLQVTRVGDDFMMKDESFTKAVNVGAASAAAGYAFTPIVWDQDVIDITRRMTPLLTIIPKLTNKGKAAYYYRITARGTAAKLFCPLKASTHSWGKNPWKAAPAATPTSTQIQIRPTISLTSAQA